MRNGKGTIAREALPLVAGAGVDQDESPLEPVSRDDLARAARGVFASIADVMPPSLKSRVVRTEHVGSEGVAEDGDEVVRKPRKQGSPGTTQAGG